MTVIMVQYSGHSSIFATQKSFPEPEYGHSISAKILVRVKDIQFVVTHKNVYILADATQISIKLYTGEWLDVDETTADKIIQAMNKGE